MALFNFHAIDAKGKNKKGKIDAANLKAAKQNLQSQGLMITDLKVSHSTNSSKNKGNKSVYNGKVSSKVIASFTRQFAMLQKASVPYDRALEILIQETKDPEFLHVLSEVKSKVVEGSPFATAIEPFPELFPNMYVAMVKAGETGGMLPKVMEKLGAFLEATEELKGKLQNALIYPIVMSFVGLGIVGFMLTFILPKITPIFTQFDLQLPLPTRIVIGLSSFVSASWWLLALIFGGGFFLFRAYKKTPSGALKINQISLKMPVLGGLLAKVYHFRFAQTLSVLLASGVAVKPALDIVAKVTGSPVFELAFEQVQQDVTKKGLDLSQALKKTELFPASLVQMIRIGEEGGLLEDMLDQISTSLEKEVAQTVQGAVALLEPILIVTMAIAVGFIAISVMLPMFELNQMI
ncbi:MAG: type II secretion system F family protein [SAR324 cluster bacterium]|nr:type II secretion system F family protein [SAR324 cluster bacterium]